MTSKLFAYGLVFMTASSIVTAQNRFETGVLLGFQHTLAQRGPQYKTNVSEVKFLKPISRSVGLYGNIRHAGRKLFYGIEFMYDDNNYGYEAASHNLKNSPGLSLTSGVMSASDYINLYKGGIRIGCSLYEGKRIRLSGMLTPSLGYYKWSSILADTSANSFWRDDRVEIQYINFPTWQRQGVYFFLKGTVELQYRWSKHFSTSFMMSYQQGFSPFVIDTMNIIRPFEPAGPQQHKYWTKVNGTAMQWHFGFTYIFGQAASSAQKLQPNQE